MSEEDLTVPVYVARNLSEADLISGLLEANGIDAHIEDEEGVTMLDGIVSGNLGVTVSVLRADAGTARDVIEEARALGRLAADEEE